MAATPKTLAIDPRATSLTSAELAVGTEMVGYLSPPYPRNSAIAIAGNAMQESSGDPTSLNAAEGSYGLLNWLGGRLTGTGTPLGLRPWCAANNLDPASVEGQCKFIVYETPHEISATVMGWLTDTSNNGEPARSIATLTADFMQYDERPSNGQVANRISYAEQIATHLGALPPVIPPVTPPVTPPPIIPPPVIPPVTPPVIPPLPPITVTPPPSQPAAAVFDPISIAIIDVIVGSIFKWGHNLPTMPGALPPAPVPLPAPISTIPSLPVNPSLPLSGFNLGGLLGILEGMGIIPSGSSSTTASNPALPLSGLNLGSILGILSGLGLSFSAPPNPALPISGLNLGGFLGLLSGLGIPGLPFLAKKG
jgi:hypothetical protein